MSTKTGRGELVVMALLGALAGSVVLPRLARACECPDPTWLVTLASVSAEDGEESDAALWPSEGDATVGDTSVTLELAYTDGDVAGLRVRGIR